MEYSLTDNYGLTNLEAHVNRLEALIEEKKFVLAQLKETYLMMQKEIRIRRYSKYSNVPSLFIVASLALGCVVIACKWLDLI